MPGEKELDALAARIDGARAEELRRTLSGRPSQSVAALLGAAFPPLAPVHPWQVAALDAVAQEGWHYARSADHYRQVLARVPAGEAFAAGLRRTAWAERARIALRELLPVALGGEVVERTAAELAALAEVISARALAEAVRLVEARYGAPTREDGARASLCVLGFGKLGGGELNAGSDIDLMFVYDTDEGRAGEVTLHEFWTRVVQRFVALLEEPTEDGFVERVDLRLRPEGSQGPLAMSFSAAERYYETWGRLWERAAMLRARCVAGDARLGAAFDREVIRPFVYRREVDPTLATALAELVERSRLELSSAPARDVKLGEGGIREAEFFIQSLQLIWGGREPSLQVQGSRQALQRLLGRGYVTAREADEVGEGLWALRRLEHRIQWMTGLQTHLIPTEPAVLERLARSLYHEESSQLLALVAQVRARLHWHFRSLSPAAPRLPPRHAALVAALAEPPSAELDRRLLEALGRVETADHLRALARRPDGLLGTAVRERHPELSGALLEAVLDSPDPEAAASGLRSLFGRLLAPGAYIAALAREPHALSRLVTVLGSSTYVAHALAARPDLMDLLVFGAPSVGRALPSQVLAAELAMRRRYDDPIEDRESFVGALRRAKIHVQVAVAMADLAGELETDEVTELLSLLADAILAAAVCRALPPGAEGLALLAVGKLGGRDIGYASDLDVIFVFSRRACPDPDLAEQRFSRVAQDVVRLITEAHPAGPGYELDTRLRPSGSQGMLVTSLGAFARYHRLESTDEASSSRKPAVLSSGAAWERQALLRARAAAGDPQVGAEASALAARAAYEGGAPSAEELHRLRIRMEKELGQERPGRLDFKYGRGGLVDIEFAVQWLQMRHGADAALRTTETRRALALLRSAGHLSPERHEVLAEAYEFLQRLSLRVQLTLGQSSSRLDERAPRLTAIARSMGLRDSAEGSARALFLERYRQTTDAVRGVYLAALGVPAEG